MEAHRAMARFVRPATVRGATGRGMRLGARPESQPRRPQQPRPPGRSAGPPRHRAATAQGHTLVSPPRLAEPAVVPPLRQAGGAGGSDGRRVASARVAAPSPAARLPQRPETSRSGVGRGQLPLSAQMPVSVDRSHPWAELTSREDEEVEQVMRRMQQDVADLRKSLRAATADGDVRAARTLRAASRRGNPIYRQARREAMQNRGMLEKEYMWELRATFQPWVERREREILAFPEEVLSERNVRQLVRRLHSAVDRRIRLEVQRRREQDWDLRQLVRRRLATDRWRSLRKAWVQHGASGFAAAAAASQEAAEAKKAAEATARAGDPSHSSPSPSPSPSPSGSGSGSGSRGRGLRRKQQHAFPKAASPPPSKAFEPSGQNRPAAVAMAAAQAAGMQLQPKRRRRRGARLGVGGAAGMDTGGAGGGGTGGRGGGLLSPEERDRQMDDVTRALETVDASLARAAAPSTDLTEVAATDLSLKDKLDMLGARLDAQQRRKAALLRKRHTLREKMAWLATEA